MSALKRIVCHETWQGLDYDSSLPSGVCGVMHSGQLKLLCSAINFLTQNARPLDLVLYSGADLGDHVNVLARMFPELEFHVYDNCEVNTSNAINISHIPRKFQMCDVNRYAKHSDNLLFMSDMRTVKRNKNGEVRATSNSNANVIDNLRLQKRMVTGMGPRASMLKLRLPYTEEGMQGERFEYFKGDMHVQPFANKTSAEVRLHVGTPDDSGTFASAQYDLRNHERTMFHYNIVDRRAHFDSEKPKQLSQDHKLAHAVIAEWCKMVSVDPDMRRRKGSTFARDIVRELDASYGRMLSLRLSPMAHMLLQDQMTE